MSRRVLVSESFSCPQGAIFVDAVLVNGELSVTATVAPPTARTPFAQMLALDAARQIHAKAQAMLEAEKPR